MGDEGEEERQHPCVSSQRTREEVVLEGMRNAGVAWEAQ